MLEVVNIFNVTNYIDSFIILYFFVFVFVVAISIEIRNFLKKEKKTQLRSIIDVGVIKPLPVVIEELNSEILNLTAVGAGSSLQKNIELKSRIKNSIEIIFVHSALDVDTMETVRSSIRFNESNIDNLIKNELYSIVNEWGNELRVYSNERGRLSHISNSKRRTYNKLLRIYSGISAEAYTLKRRHDFIMTLQKIIIDNIIEIERRLQRLK